MLSSKTLCDISKCFQHACYLKMVPFDWDPQTFKLTVVTDYRIFVPFFIFTYTLCNSIYLLVSFLVVRQSMSLPIQSIHIFWTVSYFVGTVMSSNNLVQKHKMATFVNHFFSHQKLNQGNG